ncbi:DEAD/DEAH box helicase family protein [bacterium]|nr:DEAD/DEAH box helicase family protein [bacterium]
MIKRFSSRREKISDSLLKTRLNNSQSYDRIAGFFRSSIFEVAGEAIESVSGKIRIVCNSELLAEDVRTAKLANASMRKEWCEGKPEEIENARNRFKRLYEFLKSGKLQVRVLPNDRFGLIHGKAGVITLEDGTKTAFLGSVNESKTAWKINYELAWEDNSKEAVDWVQEEFDSLWNDDLAKDLSEFIIEDIKRISERVEINNIAKWKDEKSEPAVIAVESPVYREQLGLWEHQKYFVDLAFKDHKRSYGARYILADQVGLGKTIQLAMSAQLMALYGNKPVLIIVPKTLVWQWQDEMNNLLDLPSAVWDGKQWVDENEIKYPNRGSHDIVKCPRKIGIVSQGIITSGSETSNYLLNKEYECVIVDEAHRSRRRNLGNGKENQPPNMNNLYAYLIQLSQKTHSMLLATATPIQLYPIELWDLLNILSQKNDSVLGSPSSCWRRNSKISESFELIKGNNNSEIDERDSWEWMRNPLPPPEEHPNFSSLRTNMNIGKDVFVCNELFDSLKPPLISRVNALLSYNFFQNFNPLIRHVVRRERIYLENETDPTTGEPYLQKIIVELHGENENETLELTGYMKDAYEYAEKFCQLLGQRVKSAGFLKTLLLKRIGSSLEAGRRTGQKMLDEWGDGFDSFLDEQQGEDDIIDTNQSDLKNITPEEKRLLQQFVNALNSNEAIDPKFNKVVELLEEGWKEKGVIIFSQYYDTAYWVAEKLSNKFSNDNIALYAGGDKSGVFFNSEFKKESKDSIKSGVKSHKYKILIGTDSASEGLNLQTLGTLINLDLPWNPTRLEQRKGRIQRIGQANDTVHIYNMRYKDSVEDRVHELLSQRLQNISSIFGQLPDVLEDVWIQIAQGEIDEAKKIIDNVPDKNPFEIRYNQKVSNIDWDSCTSVLNALEKRKYFRSGWY